MESSTYYATAFKGLGRITARELRRRFGSDIRRIETQKIRDWDVVQFHFPHTPGSLMQMGTIEDLFHRVGSHPLSGNKKELLALESLLTPNEVEPALASHRKIAGARGNRKRTTFRVIVQSEGEFWKPHRRNQIRKAIGVNIKKHYPRWTPVSDQADLEVWIQIFPKNTLIGLRLSDRTLRHRTYKIASSSGSLRPTIAHAVAQLSNPEPGDIFLDPMCGDGTILIERAMAERYEIILGGDIQEEAVRNTLSNFGNRHKPREIRHWDARNLPFESSSVNKVATNLPWGRQFGTPDENETLYRDFLKEVDRVLSTGGTAVFLTVAWKLFKSALKSSSSLILTEQVQNIVVLGHRADIFVLRKWV